LGMSSDEYLLELVTQGLDPKDRALEYVEAAKDLLTQAQEELRKDNIKQAAEKVWGATALAVKAYALWKEGRRLTSHSELWQYKDDMVEELGEWVHDAWNAGQSMHVCFYEGWCTRKSVEAALKQARKLVKEVSTRVER